MLSSIATTTTVVSSQNPSTFGGEVTFTATVTAIDEGAVTGDVTFRADGTPVPGCSNLPVGPLTSGGYGAICSTSTLPVGRTRVRAQYGGTSTKHLKSSGATVVEVVEAASPSPTSTAAR